jgi:sec-independent protein translocase protein TatC
VAVTADRPELNGPTGDGAAEEPGTMTLAEHLGELRWRLIVAICAVVAGAIAAWFLYDPILHFMVHPYETYARHHPAKDITKGQLITNGPLEGFTTRLKVSVYVGLALASPVVLWELWRFITPGLHRNEKRYAIPFVLSAVVLFALGVTTAILVFPKAIDWLISVSGSSVTPLFTASRYFNLYALMCLAFGTVFLYPIVLVFLMLSGVVPSARWRRWRRVAIVVIAAVAAVITPSSDPFSFIAMAVPMYVFYEGSIILGRLLKK